MVFILVFAAFIMTLFSAAGKLPVWIPLLIVEIALLISMWSATTNFLNRW